jgi:hypothetical protein
MSNMPNDIRNMWEQAAGMNEAKYKPMPGLPSLGADHVKKMKMNEPKYRPMPGLPSLGADHVSQMKRNASTQQRPLTDQEHAAIARHAENAAKKNADMAHRGKN